ncbi:hypothetical protein MCAP1_001323 [Malassezia caprae]|uniref:SLC41A/MgtE integral membrane domain-containing protein n=1 Tax=Malassezia caprae TaxID=1381934 RepID=A0AAF0IW22_9BASI|nr:hypothetical protein MCAP1_001323 [Malassezia caprae]
MIGAQGRGSTSRWANAWALTCELDRVATWSAFVKVDKFLILVPILFNLKGNLEMNLSMRMTTAANIGELDNYRTRRALVTGNMALLQVQSLIVSCAAGILSFVLGHHDRSDSSEMARRGPVHSTKPTMDKALRLRDGYFEFALVLAVAQFTASFSSAIQGAFVCACTIWARYFGLNPDNMVVPLAGSLGDLVTMTCLGLCGSAFVVFEGTGIATALFIGLILASLLFAVVTARNAYVHELLSSGWLSLFAAAAVSSLAGLVLEQNAGRYQGYPLLAPVVAGVPGITAAVHASRLTSALHSKHFLARTRPSQGAGYVPVDAQAASSDTTEAAPQMGWRQQLLESLQPQVPEWDSPMVLLFHAVITQVLFFVALHLSGTLVFDWAFGIALVVVCILLAAGGLALAHTLCLFLWSAC